MNNKDKRWLLNYLEERKRSWQTEIAIANQKILELKQELNCKRDCVYRDPKAKVPPFCRYGDRKAIIENDVCKSYIKEPV